MLKINLQDGSTASFLEEQIQLFQDEYASYKCYKCKDSDPYMFFSEDANSMLKFSSAWFSCDGERATPQTIFKPNQIGITDIGFCKNIALSNNLKNRKEINNNNTQSRNTKPEIKEISKKPEQVITPVYEVKEHEDHKNIVKHPFAPKTLNQQHKTKPSFATKIATSKFGRTRKVLDFQFLEKTYDDDD